MINTRQTSKTMPSDDADLLNSYSGSGSGSAISLTTTTTTTTATSITKLTTSTITGTNDFYQTVVPENEGSIKGPVPLSPLEGKDQDCIPIIAATACGVVVVLGIIIVVIIICRRRRRRDTHKEIEESKPHSYTTAMEMSATKRNTLEVRPVTNSTLLYSVAESERAVSSPPSSREHCPPSKDSVEGKSSSNTSDGQSKLDESSREDHQNERYSHPSIGNSRQVSACNNYETFHDYENPVAGNDETRMSAEISENPYDDIADPQN